MTDVPSESRRYSQAFPAEARVVRIIRDEVGAVAQECGVEPADLHHVRLGVTEAVTNAIVHGYGRSEMAADAREEIRVEVFHDADELVVVIVDDGAGLAPRVGSPGMGLGLPVVASVAKRLELRTVEHGGTEVHMTFPCPAAGRRPVA